MTRVIVLLSAVALFTGCSDNKSAIERAQEKLSEVRKEATEKVYAAEQKLTRSIADSQKNISQASGQTSSAISSGTTQSQDSSTTSEFCRGLEVGGVTPAELQTYNSSCKQ